MKTKTAAAFLALTAGAASYDQAVLPVLAADDPEFEAKGGNWRGSVWPAMNAIVLYGLERYGYEKLAEDLATNHVDSVAKVWKKTGTILETYPPDSLDSGNSDHPAFVGGSGIGPTKFLLRYVIGLRPNAPENTLVWKLNTKYLQYGPFGCRQFRFGDILVDILATKQEDEIEIQVSSNHVFKLVIHIEETEVLSRDIYNEACLRVPSAKINEARR